MLLKANALLKQNEKEVKSRRVYRAYEIATTGLAYRDKMRRSLVEILKDALNEITQGEAEKTARKVEEKLGCPDPSVHSPLGNGPNIRKGDLCYDPAKHKSKDKVDRGPLTLELSHRTRSEDEFGDFAHREEKQNSQSVAPFGFVPAGKRTADDWAVECALRLEDALYKKF